MLTHINTITFNGLDVLDVDVQAQMSSGLPNFIIVGLPDKAIAESKERVRAAYSKATAPFAPATKRPKPPSRHSPLLCKR